MNKNNEDLYAKNQYVADKVNQFIQDLTLSTRPISFTGVQGSGATYYFMEGAKTENE